jgi:hypothetical protein
MNRVIEDLKKQCISREVRGTNAFDSYMVDKFDSEKFAELIVRKCISEVAMMGVVQYDNEDIAWAVNMIIGNLKETFEIKNMTTGKSGTSGAPESFEKRIL